MRTAPPCESFKGIVLDRKRGGSPRGGGNAGWGLKHWGQPARELRLLSEARVLVVYGRFVQSPIDDFYEIYIAAG
jgi:hypothetical protein